MNRNFALVRSILVGLSAKTMGAFLVFLGLPLIARHLQTVEYANFLTGMAVTSMFSILYGASNTSSVRALSFTLSAGSEEDFRSEFRMSMGACLVITLMSAVGFAIYGTVMWQYGNELPIGTVTAVLLTLLTGAFQWGDNYWVAARRDYISSIAQMGGGLAIVCLLIAFTSDKIFNVNTTLVGVVVIYFGVPTFIAMSTAFLASWKSEINYEPIFSVPRLVGRMREMMPLCLNSLVDYMKIFGAPLILLYFTHVETYTHFATIVLFIARLTNPMSLITRPLLPAVIDAHAIGDAKWINNLKAVLIVASVCIATFCIASSFILDPAWMEWVIPAGLGRVSRLEIFSGAILLWSQLQIASLMPLYVAKSLSNEYFLINCFGILAGIAGGLVLIYVGMAEFYITAVAFSNGAAAILMLVAIVNSLSVR